MIIKCTYCKNEATNYRVFDIDLPKIPLCDDQKCFIKLYIKLNTHYEQKESEIL